LPCDRCVIARNRREIAARSVCNHRAIAVKSPVKSLQNRREISVQSQCDHRPITVQSLRYHRVIAVQSLYNRRTIAALSPCNRRAIAAQSLRDHRAITARSPCNRCAIVLELPCYHRANAVKSLRKVLHNHRENFAQSQRNCGRVAAQSLCFAVQSPRNHSPLAALSLGYHCAIAALSMRCRCGTIDTKSPCNRCAFTD
jgi:hypothetical protein